MAEPLRSSDGRLTEEEGNDGTEFHSDQSSGVHVESKVEGRMRSRLVLSRPSKRMVWEGKKNIRSEFPWLWISFWTCCVLYIVPILDFLLNFLLGADDGNHSTLVQKLKGRLADTGDRMKGKESSEKEDPHPELGNLRPATGSGDSFGSNPQTEGKQHGGVPISVIANDSISHGKPAGWKSEMARRIENLV